MTPLHLANLIVHVGAGGLAIAAGALVLARKKGDAQHRARGRRVVYLTTVVVATAAIGLLAFRQLPLFAVLTLLVGYQLLSGWRVARTQAQGPQWLDAVATVLAIGIGIPLADNALTQAPQARAVILAGIGGLGLVVCYDVLRFAFPRRWHSVVWPYEHIYKLNAALFGMVSAFVGNTVRVGQPWSQLLPSIVGTIIIVYHMWRWSRRPPTSDA
jgi:uncharacterized membrane protein